MSEITLRGLDGRLITNEPAVCSPTALITSVPLLSKSATTTAAPAAPAVVPAVAPAVPMSLMPEAPLTQPLESVPATKLVEFAGRMLMIGMGAVGTASLPLILKHIAITPQQITVLTGDDRAEAAAEMAAEFPGLTVVLCWLDEANYAAEIAKYVGPGDMIVNLSVDVSSVAVLEWCAAHDVLYMDTVVEPWAGFYTNKKLSASARSNYALREAAMALKHRLGPNSATAVLTHGANPGLISHLVKEGLLHVRARLAGGEAEPAPKSRAEWAALAQRVGLRAIHVAERDTQVQSGTKQPNEFINTWSVDGFISEGCQPAELGWGTHEKQLPPKGARHESGCDAAIYINRPGASMRVRTWAPSSGPFHGFLITHNEAISLADYLTVPGAAAGAPAAYRPTVHYAYHPCGDAVVSLHEFAGRGWVEQTNKRILCDEIVAGTDELGALLMGTDPATGEHYAYWYGSQLDIHQARKLATHNTATTLQISSAVLAATIWAMRNPRVGLVEAEELPHDDILNVCKPYIAPVVGVFTNWTPLENRNTLFDEDVDAEDPWQFKNIVVE